MTKSRLNLLNYMIALITEFAKAHKLCMQDAYLYLKQFKGLDFVEEFYDVEHTLPFDNAVEDVTIYCKRMGGHLS
ncbi:MAG: DUF3791 domain-containing protein [Muribaculaceae bacterium]|nr:DUF3791 domain-containing protein [Muribaculaceae bacterium]